MITTDNNVTFRYAGPQRSTFSFGDPGPNGGNPLFVAEMAAKILENHGLVIERKSWDNRPLFVVTGREQEFTQELGIVLVEIIKTTAVTEEKTPSTGVRAIEATPNKDEGLEHGANTDGYEAAPGPWSR